MVDELDSRILLLLAEEPRVGVLEASRRLGVARGTVQARLDKLIAAGVVRSLAPSLDPGNPSRRARFRRRPPRSNPRGA